MHIERGSLGQVTPERCATVVIPLSITIQRTQIEYFDVLGWGRGQEILVSFHPSAQGAEIWKCLQDGIIDMYCFITSHMLMFLKNSTLSDG